MTMKPVVQETLRLVGVVESQSRELMGYSADPIRRGENFQDLKRFVEKIEHFYVFVDLVEGRIPEFDAAKQEPLRKHLSKIRWKVIILELDTTRVYLVQITEGKRKLPMGAREFLLRRLERLSEIAQYYDRFGDAHELAPPAEVLIRAVEDLLRRSIENAPATVEFKANAPGAELPRRSATPPAPLPGTLAPISIPSGGGMAAFTMAPRQAPLPPIPEKLKIKETWGRFYVEKGSLVAVSQACKTAAISLDQLAQKLGVTRMALTLMLNGQDPMPRKAIEQLQAFMLDQAKRSRPPL